MKYLYCSEKNRRVNIGDTLSKAAPVVVSVEPFVGEMEAILEINEGGMFKGVCSHLHGEKESFTIPRYLKSFSDLPKDTYFVLTHDDNTYTTYFCLSHSDQMVSISYEADKGLLMKLKSGTKGKKERSALLCVRGDHLHQTIQITMRLALMLTGGLGKIADEKPVLPNWLNSLGWESGATFGNDVTHEKVVNAIWSLRQMGFHPGYVIIDEGWQELEVNPKDKYSRKAMVSFNADKERFPLGLKGLTEDLQRAGVKQVGVWHGMMGSREGIHPGLAQKYDLPHDKDGRYFLGYDLGRSFHFFHDYYSYLREQGITFIKVGDQSSIESFSLNDPTNLYKNLQSGIQAAAAIQFNSAHFNTECLRNENLFYWTTSRIARSADDIDILNPLGAKRAIRNNLSNALWLHHLMQPDFDAWITNSAQSEMMAIFHSLSGTINVISDPPGGHNKDILKKIVLPNGHLLQADKPLTLCEGCVFFDPLEEKKIVKGFTLKENHGIIAVFNLTSGKRTLHGEVSANDIEGLTGDLFAVFSHNNGFVGLTTKDKSLSITLKPNQADVFTFAPIQEGIAVLGSYSYYLTPGPITEINVEDESMHITSMVAAPMVIYSERKILEVRRNGSTIPWEYDSNRKILSIDSRSSILNMHAIYSISFE